MTRRTPDCGRCDPWPKYHGYRGDSLQRRRRSRGGDRRSGYEINYAYAEDGSQIIRDRYGGILTRPASSRDLASATVHADPTQKLVALVSRLDALLTAVSPILSE